jgi:hypothetical protein
MGRYEISLGNGSATRSRSIELATAQDGMGLL